MAGLDIGKASLVCCARVPDEAKPGRRLQEVRTYPTMTRSLIGLAERLAALGVTRVVMEATSDYWKPVFYLLEAHGFEVWLVNARDVKHLPGRPKTDKLDAVWLCKVAERQMIRPSFVPPAPIRMLRDLTRYRVDLIAEAGAERNRAEKLLEDAQIKLSVVVSDLFGTSGRAMMAALIAGQRDPHTLAELARSSLRRKIPALQEALTGHFTDHHAFLLGKMITRIEQVEADIREVDARIEAQLAPFAPAAARLLEIPGVGPAAAPLTSPTSPPPTGITPATAPARWPYSASPDDFAGAVGHHHGQPVPDTATGARIRQTCQRSGQPSSGFVHGDSRCVGHGRDQR
ncbi:IS110 family transposase [Micromonospora sp. WMMD710]|uniref:IS110 family transposase n=1 Tax=Micromonospora sp. WMMD710 TaxID=3016085 RepID=UPI002416AF22|nr:IS110 family transposase [Micromonospora sp. WMMD710]MDG4757157.1 IS110 family transposase [Micromonospora sp. WMMD710]